ncbi:hypothetical protein F0562_008281 [Nyssa sinensis]|uniref:TF-B3 domain-containing protein n=1 Tax=Nyssa sinensis TaxID=561372 RepID=A0A5J5A9M3_9ASTE|nr:hypothetical protein F0562_008281 [Nyssa sinensis]
MMKKIFYYNLVPSKAEEDVAKITNIPFQGNRFLVEIRDVYPPPPPDPNNPWQIRKRLTASDVVTGKLKLSHNETFDHIFRHWTLDMANYVIMGHKAPVVVWDVTDDVSPKRLANPGDEVGLFWEMRNGAFQFKLLRRDV